MDARSAPARSDPDQGRAAGFEPEAPETVLVGPAAPLAAGAPALPAGIALREVVDRADLVRVAAMETRVWGADQSYRADALAGELGATPDGITIVVAETTDEPSTVVSAGWVRYVPGTVFATLWGGSTLPQWRGRGIYRALVAGRARLAIDRGYSLLQVDASADSRPILERNGFLPLTTTTPYVYTPPS